MSEVVTTTASEDETRAVATELAARLRPGDMVLLEGPLGAGKTLFAQAIGAALGVSGPMPSPTYAMVHRHETAAGVPLVHVDLYRVEGDDELFALGLDDDFDVGAIVIVEWPERAPILLNRARFHVSLNDAGPTTRTLTVRERG